MKNNNFTSYCFHTTTIMTTSVGGHLLQSNLFLLTGPHVHFPEPSARLEHDAQIVIVHQRGRSQFVTVLRSGLVSFYLIRYDASVQLQLDFIRAVVSVS